MGNVTQTASCAHCGEAISPQHIGPCPKCGKEGKNVNITIKDTVEVHSSLNFETRKEYYKKHKGAAGVVITIALLSPFLGLLLVGPTGVIIGLILGGVSYYLGPKASTKIIEITKRHA